MKKIITLIVMIFVNFLISTNTFSLPVTVNGSISLDYSDLTSAFNAINLGTHGNGNITVLINESHTITSTAILNGGVFTSCEIKPTSEVTVNGSFDDALILLDGADRVTIDGRIGLISDIKLTLTNTAGCIEMKNGATDNNIKFVQCISGLYYFSSIYISQSMPGTGGNNNNSVEDSNFGEFRSTGTGGASGYVNRGTKIFRNKCGGIFFYLETGDNEIKNNKCSYIYLWGVGINSIIDNEVYLYREGTGINIVSVNLTAPGSDITEINVINNFITVNANSFCFECFPYFGGISVAPYIFNGNNNVSANIFYNTVFLTGSASPITDGFASSGIYAKSTSPGFLNIRNNLIINAVGCDGGRGDSYGSHIETSGDNVTADYNCYLNIGSAPSGHARWNSTSAFNINDYRSAVFPNEQHTIFKNASFADALSGNLHLAGSSIGDIDLSGIQIPGITTDIDNQPRISPYKGADEVTDSPLPVELSSFTSSVMNNNVILHWTTASETNNSGFEIQKSKLNGEWSIMNFINGQGNSNIAQDYSYEDRNLASGKYNYRLKQMDYNGNFKYYELSNEVVIGIPDKYNISQNYPNPFNPTTNIDYEIPFDGKVNISVFEISGRELANLVNDVKTAGYYTLQFNAHNLASGTYFYRITSKNFIATKKMILLK